MNYYNYFTEIEDAFVRRRGKNLLLSPLDWAMIEGWQERGIPLHVVLRAIESVFDAFDKKPAQPRAIKSLFYCREEVEAQFVEWTASQVGRSSGEQSLSGGSISKADIEKFLDESIDRLKAGERQDIKEDQMRAVSRLNELRENLPDQVELIEPTLHDIQKFLDRALLSNSDPEHLKIVKKEISQQLKAYKASMEKEAYANTFDLMLLKRLRDDAGIPRLSLYHL